METTVVAKFSRWQSHEREREAGGKYSVRAAKDGQRKRIRVGGIEYGWNCGEREAKVATDEGSCGYRGRRGCGLGKLR